MASCKEKPSPSYQAHMAAIEAGEVTRTNIIGIRKLLNGAVRRSMGWSAGMSTPLGTLEQADALLEAIRKHRPRVTGQLHDTGITLLRNPRYKKRWAAYQREAIDSLDHFRLVDFDQEGRWGEYAVPVYQVWAKVPPKGDALDGGSYAAFAFRNIPWQSGGDGPEVVSRGI